jgi:hypothetical protein
MGKPHPIGPRERVLAFVDEGHGHREAARHFRVSAKFVNDLVRLRRETGALAPRRQGNGGRRGKLAGVTDWVGPGSPPRASSRSMNSWPNWAGRMGLTSVASRFGGFCAASA